MTAPSWADINLFLAAFNFSMFVCNWRIHPNGKRLRLALTMTAAACAWASANVIHFMLAGVPP
jgi:hypothetical protein